MEKDLESQPTQGIRFIQNKPCGEDKFEGGSQERLAKTIAQHFRQNDTLDENRALPRIIGIEGVWGSGKSNVVKMLEKNLADDYHFFEYDAWGHQEDLQRRSILELLTAELIDAGILFGKTTIKVKGGGIKSVTWTEKLKYLLARKTENQTEKFPLISPGVVGAFLVAVLTPIFTYIAYAVKPTPTTWWFSLLSIFIAAFPVLVASVIWWIAYRKDHKYGLSYLLAIYQDKIEKEVCYETISEDEPTVVEFKNWMQDISDFIQENNQRKLVLVFDNMDRLPAEKVKELWSSIHTFFAGSGFENVWAVIPFDEKHLACAFGDESKEITKQLTKYFINKTFPIVYRVAPPVITDYRNIFDKLFIEAFGSGYHEDKDTINRIYRITNPNANVREIISYINEMVALKQEWGNAISIVSIALFCLKKSQILENPVEQILSGSYIEGINKIVDNDLQTQREMAALVYGVDVEHARQIPLTKYIEGCINGEEEHDINQYAESNKQFDTVLDEVVKNMDDSLVDNIIHCLHKLTRKNDSILQIWQRLSTLKIKDSIKKQEFPMEYKEMLLHLTPERQNKIIAQLYKKIVRFQNFNGADYFKALYEIDGFIRTNELLCDLVGTIEDKEVESSIFVDYVRAANEAKATYGTYKIQTNPELLDTYLAELLPNNFNHTDIVRTLRDSPTYQFPTLLLTIKTCIKANNINKDNIGEIFSTYRLLAPKDERPLSEQLDTTSINQLHSELESDSRNIKESGYYDLVAMKLANDQPVSLIEGGEVKDVAEIMDYYAVHSDMLTKCLSSNNPLLNSVLQYTVKNRLGEKLSIVAVLQKFVDIIKRIGVEEEDFIRHLSDWNKDLNREITKENIKNVIPNATFYGLTTRIDNALTKHINKTAIEALSALSTDSLYNQKANHTTDYWLVAVKHLAVVMDSLPDNLTEFGKRIMLDIAAGTQSISPMPEYLSILVEKLDISKIKTTIKNIRNDFCNGQKSINPTRFKFFEELFRLYGDMADRAGDAVDKIVRPVISDVDCRSMILQNSQFYITLITNAGDEATELKQQIRNIAETDKTEEFAEFANAVLTEQENE